MADVRGGSAVKADVTQASTAAWTSATGDETTLAHDMDGMSVVVVQLTRSGAISAGNVRFEVSPDGGTTWFYIAGKSVATRYWLGPDFALATFADTTLQFDVAGYTDFRVRLETVITGAGTANVRIQASAAPANLGLKVRQLKTADINDAASGDNTIVAAVTAKRIRVAKIVLNVVGTVNAYWRDGVAGTQLTGDMNFQAREGYVAEATQPDFLLQTTAGNALVLNLSAAIAVDGWVTYWDDDPD